MFKLIKSIEEYASIVRDVKCSHHQLVTNSFMLKTALERLIRQRRLMYTKTGGGVYFLEDEIEYYNLVFFADLDSNFELTKLNKPVIIKIINRLGRYNDSLAQIESVIRDRGFTLQKSYTNVQCEASEMLYRINTIFPKAESYLDRFGIDIVNPDKELISEIRRMQYEIDSIPFYEIDFRTDEEICEAARTGYLITAINRDSCELCGANYCIVNGHYVSGWIAIRDKYRDVPGISVCMHKWAAERDSKNNHIKKTWIAKDNHISMDYHERLGFRANGEEMNIWVLNDK